MSLPSALLLCLSAVVASACSKNTSNFAPPHASSNPSLPKELKNPNHSPGNIYWCEGGTVIGFDIHVSQNQKIYQYFFDGTKLEQHGNRSAVDPRNNNKIMFELDPPNLTVFIADPLGNGMNSINCLHHID